MSTSGSSTFSSAMAVDPEHTEQYESLYEISKKAVEINLEEIGSSCSSSCDEDDNGNANNIMSVLGLQEEAIRKSCEEEIEQYIHQQQTGNGEKADTGNHAEIGPCHMNGESVDTPTKTGGIPSQQPQQATAVEELPDLPLEIGDHVYQWRTFVGIPRSFQHHGIVLDIERDKNGEMELKIADFSCILNKFEKSPPSVQQNYSVDMKTGGTRSGDKKSRFNVHPQGILRVYKSSSSDPPWHKVVYKASVWKTSLWRSGTCTCVSSDPPAKVLARAYFLLENPNLLPSYHIFRSNCECLSLWCKTGFWCTLQASSLLSLTAAGQLKSTATLAAYVSSQQVTVQTPAAGLWGYLGYTTTTQVSLLSTQPHLLPLLAAYGVVTAGGPTFVLWRAKKFWEATTKRLNEEFWNHALNDPEMFSQSMMYWSERHKAFVER